MHLRKHLKLNEKEPKKKKKKKKKKKEPKGLNSLNLK